MSEPYTLTQNDISFIKNIIDKINLDVSFLVENSISKPIKIKNKGFIKYKWNNLENNSKLIATYLMKNNKKTVYVNIMSTSLNEISEIELWNPEGYDIMSLPPCSDLILLKDDKIFKI